MYKVDCFSRGLWLVLLWGYRRGYFGNGNEESGNIEDDLYWTGNSREPNSIGLDEEVKKKG